MASQTADDGGFVTEQTLSHYARLAEGRPGLLMVEYTYVHRSGRSEDRQLGIQSDTHVDGLKRLARTIQASGALAGIQITHAGGKTERTLTEGQLMAPSGIAVPVKDRSLEVPTPMADHEITLWKEAFLQAVDRAVQAGFDCVEFHSAHGYGLNQWLSGITNQRTDAYGGGLKARMALLLEIVQAARSRYPHLLLSVRMPGQDFIGGGLEIEDTIEIAQALERIGIDLIHVSSGIGGWRRPGNREGEGYLVNEATRIQASVRIPVIGVGGIETGTYIDHGLQTHQFALAAVGRAILKDPKTWQIKNL
jgi:NADPH2 dehydrogenase